jgi:hypothetical protein
MQVRVLTTWGEKTRLKLWLCMRSKVILRAPSCWTPPQSPCPKSIAPKLRLRFCLVCADGTEIQSVHAPRIHSFAARASLRRRCLISIDTDRTNFTSTRQISWYIFRSHLVNKRFYISPIHAWAFCGLILALHSRQTCLVSNPDQIWSSL